MLYAGCGRCGQIVPLMCSGRFPPHAAVYVAQTPMGAVCSMCGLLPPFFMCMNCGTQQLLVLPGGPAPAPAFPGGYQTYAPVVQANAGASQQSVKQMFMKLATTGVGAFGEQAAQEIFGGWQ